MRSNVHDVFNNECAAGPCAMYFDELDSIAKARGRDGGEAGGAGDRVPHQILTEMDSMHSMNNIFIIGATNRPYRIDLALRPDCLDRLHLQSLFRQRLSIFKATLHKSPVAPDVDLAFLTERIQRYSGADLTEIYQIAAKLAIRESTDSGIR